MIERASNKCKHLESMPSQDSGEVEACCKVASELTNTTPRPETMDLGTLPKVPKRRLSVTESSSDWIIDSKKRNIHRLYGLVLLHPAYSSTFIRPSM